MADPCSYKITDRSGTASSLDELTQKARTKFDIQSNVIIFLDDGTEVDDDYCRPIEPNFKHDMDLLLIERGYCVLGEAACAIIEV